MNAFLFQFILPYSVSKTALLGLVKALSHDLAQENVRVNSVAPGLIDTAFSSAVIHIQGLGKSFGRAGTTVLDQILLENSEILN